MSRSAFSNLCNTYLRGKECEKRDTILRSCIPIEKRLAIFLDWACSGSPHQSLARTYDVGKSTVQGINVDMVRTLSGQFVSDIIKFPQGQDLMRLMDEFKSLCHLPFCAGAIDGTFMKIEKPKQWGDSYWCYKKYAAIILFTCVDARGRFTYVNAGQPGSAGDAFTWNNSDLKELIEKGEWLRIPDGHESHMRLGDNTFRPYICADSAFALSPVLMKCYEVDNPSHAQFNFNYALIRTRRVVECAFGRLKKRFPILKNSRLCNPYLAQYTAIVLCALQNYIEGCGEVINLHDATAFEPSDLVGLHGRAPADQAGAAAVRDKLADHMARTLNLGPAMRTVDRMQLLNGPVGYD